MTVKTAPTKAALPPIPWNEPTPHEAMLDGCDVEDLGNADSAWAAWDAAVSRHDARLA